MSSIAQSSCGVSRMGEGVWMTFEQGFPLLGVKAGVGEIDDPFWEVGPDHMVAAGIARNSPSLYDDYEVFVPETAAGRAAVCATIVMLGEVRR
jgi:hypothetical protein